MLDLDEARAAIGREMEAALAELRAIADDDWSRPTRCAGWLVRDLVVHLVWGQRVEAQGVEAVGTGRTSPLDVPAVEAVEPVQLLCLLETAHAGLREALDQRTADESGVPAPMPYGPVPLGLLLQVITMEVGIHHSDLRDALGLPSGLAPDVAVATAAFLSAFLPVLAAASSPPAAPVSYRLRGQVVYVPFSFDGVTWRVSTPGTVPTVTFSGADSDVCLFAVGRMPLGSPSITVTGDRVAAARFRDYVPGL